jgi:hypothetical protein
LLAAQAAAPQAAPPPADEKPITVCELLRNLTKYNGKEVTVRGYVGGDRHLGYFLSDNDEDKQCENMPRGSKTWPSSTHLRWQGEDKVDKNLEAAVTQRDRQDKDKKILATIKGSVSAAKGPKIYRDLQGGYFGNGYGMGGPHPAQITIRAVTDIEKK